jgi:pyruvate dehydrogenase E2 component (dihydrolipoamide acetyltransferase)
MTEAKSTIPHFRLVSEIEVDALLELRTELCACDPTPKISLNDLLIKACATALIDVPQLNIQWVDTEIRQFVDADISVATAVVDGLLTPIIFGANRKSVREISREVRELASRARQNTLKMSEIAGGSFSISNLGMFGVRQFDAIVNSPQCAILAIGAARPSVVVTQDRAIRIATVLCATLSVDHRAIDGATAARFCAVLKACIEKPDWLRAAL